LMIQLIQKSPGTLQDATKESVQLSTIEVVQSVGKFKLHPNMLFLFLNHHHQAKEARDSANKSEDLAILVERRIMNKIKIMRVV